MTSTPSRGRSLLAGLGLSAIVLASLVGVVEVVLRTTHWLGARVSWSRPDATLGWRFLGNADYWYDSRENDRPITGRTNSGGWNDREWPPKKPPDVFRVAILGDSYVEALQVERASSFARLAEATLNQDGQKRFELMNFGRSGFTQTEEWLVLTKEIVRFDPDAVVLFYFAPNDIADVNRRTATDPLRPFPVAVGTDEVVLDTSFTGQPAFRLKSMISPLKNHSALVSLVAERVALLQAMRAPAGSENGNERSSAAARAAGIGGYLSLATDTPDALYRSNYEMTKALVAAMIRFCAQRRIDFLLVSIDTPAYLPRVEQRLKAADPTFRFGYFDRDLADLATRAGARFLGLDTAFRERYLEHGLELHFARNSPPRPSVTGNLGHPGHWNYAGHRAVAELLAEEVRTLAALRNPGPAQRVGPTGDGRM
jgi:hypothetical protein